MRRGLLGSQTYTVVAIFFVLTFGFSIKATSQKADAAGFTTTSYFEHSGSYWTTASNDQGSTSLVGSVIPNYWGDKDASGRIKADWGMASGAIGDEAIGCFTRANGGQGPGGTFDPSCNEITRKAHLYNRLKWDYDSGNPWEKAGAAEVVNNMLGKAWGTGSRTIQPAEWDDLYLRLVQNPNLIMIWRGGANGYPRRHNTAGVKITAGPGVGQYDSVRYDYDDDLPVDAWEFLDNGTSVMALEIACANGLGSYSGLPPYTPVYDLTPVITSVSPNPVESGGKVTITSKINHSGDATSRDTQWQINQIVIKSPGVPPSGGTSPVGVDPCTFYTKPFVTCSGFGAAGSGTYSRDTDLAPQISPSLDYPVGTVICYGLSLQPRANSSDEWRHSEPVCTVIGIKPKIQILGGDLKVGRAFSGANDSTSTVNTGIAVKSNGTFGSWVEYGIFAPKGIAMASAGGLATGNGGAPDAGALTSYAANQLTFANVAPPCAYGCYSTNNLGSIPDVTGKYINASTPLSPAPGAPVDAGSLSTGVHAYTGDLALNATTIQPGNWVVIRATGTVTISGNIQYTNNTLTSNSDIPQLIIIANRINIDPSVTRVDSWLVAKSTGVAGSGGIIDTCILPGVYGNTTHTTGLTSGNCDKVLTVNGPVMAEKLWLRRTGGSGTGNNSGDPAEVFNLRPDAYLWAQTQVTASSRIQTTYTKEMAPRF